MVLQLVMQITFFLLLIYGLAQAVLQPAPGCQDSCGDVDIPFPFGIGPDCYLDEGFAINCSDRIPKVIISSNNLILEVLQINLTTDLEPAGTVRVKSRSLIISSNCPNIAAPVAANVDITGSPFHFSYNYNMFTAAGCNNYATLFDTGHTANTIVGCVSNCATCQTTIPPNPLQMFNVTFQNTSWPGGDLRCKMAFLEEQAWADGNRTDPPPTIDDIQNTDYVPIVRLGWAIYNWTKNSSEIYDLMKNRQGVDCYNDSYTLTTNTLRHNSLQNYSYCRCKDGYEGNPYLSVGCTDIDECASPNPCLTFFNNQNRSILICVNTVGSYNCSALNNPAFENKSQRPLVIGVGTSLGLLVLLIAGWGSYKVIKKRKKIKRKEKFFKRNGGLLLQQQLSSGQVNVENTKMFNSKELEKATDHFNVNRILGQGGQGTVYKGMLADGRIVAVKKSKIIDEGIEEFINEVVILSQINHRNVVKLLGCCLETEVPLLVYEFISNGTLSQFINDQNEEFPLTWDVRLRIATEIAGALFYLHSAAASPIYHRDIKSTNILLDDKYRAKVADFGTSRSIAIDQTHLTTQVHGTFGYVDPEYFQSSQFTEKSDVYSFGVVLVELLTGQKAISSMRAEEGKSLATYFIRSMKDNRLFDILDSRVLMEGEKEQIIRYGNLAKRCLNLNGKKRPAMKEVTIELEAIQLMQKAPTARQNYEDVEHAKTNIYEEWDVASTSTMSGLDSSKISSLDSQPFLSS